MGGCEEKIKMAKTEKDRLYLVCHKNNITINVIARQVSAGARRNLAVFLASGLG